MKSYARQNTLRGRYAQDNNIASARLDRHLVNPDICLNVLLFALTFYFHSRLRRLSKVNVLDMFEDIKISPEITPRLRQDMNPLAPEPLPPPLPSQAPDDASAPASLSPLMPSAPVVPPLPVELLAVKVETAPVLVRVRDRGQGRLVWLAALMILPSVIFWLASLLYVAGTKSTLLAIMVRAPFPAIVSFNVVMPVASAVLAGLILAHAELGTPARLVAKVTLLLAGGCVLALGSWLAGEAF